MAQIAAAAALDDQGLSDVRAETYKKGAQLIMKACDDMKITYEPPVANFHPDQSGQRI